MENIRIKFVYHFHSSKYRENHLLFHRWLPNGKEDSIEFEVSESDLEVEIWVERFGEIKKGLIHYKLGEQAVDESVINHQGVLSAGHLFGEIRVNNIDTDEYAALNDNKIDDDAYIQLGKRVAKGFYKSISSFIRCLRVDYRQFWLNEPEKFDPRKMSLGDYCSRFQMQWSGDDGKIWIDFMPSKPVRHLYVQKKSGKDFQQFITKDDWNFLQNNIDVINDEPSLAAQLLLRSYELASKDDLKGAFIEAVSALEVAIKEYIRNNLEGEKELTESVQGFYGLSLKIQIIVLATRMESIPSEDIRNSIKAIDLRNKIVHQGKDISNDKYHLYISLVKMIELIFFGKEYKHPILGSMNRVISPEAWEESYKED